MALVWRVMVPWRASARSPAYSLSRFLRQYSPWKLPATSTPSAAAMVDTGELCGFAYPNGHAGRARERVGLVHDALARVEGVGARRAGEDVAELEVGQVDVSLDVQALELEEAVRLRHHDVWQMGLRRGFSLPA